MKQICDDLAAEHEGLDALVADLTEEQWQQPTPAEGWSIKDTIAHIAGADYAGRLAATDPEAFERFKDRMLSGDSTLETEVLDPETSSGAEVLAWWRGEREAMLDAFRAHGPKDRLPWFGPSMSALSFATARLMETWAHGSDIAATLGTELPATDRLRHVCHIGVTTRGWSYVNRGLDVPEGAVRVELTSPSGELWTWGPEDAPATVRGSALEFALVTTQRKPFAASSLACEGELARDWMERAQAFAGPPTDTDASRAALRAG